MNEQSEDKCDRELFSELLEPPIHPLLIHIVPPFIEEINPVFILQLNGEAAWRLREIYWPPQKVFELLQTSIMPLGYRPCVLTGAVSLPLDQKQRLTISDPLGNYAFGLIDAKIFRPTFAHSTCSGDRRSFKALIVALRRTRTFFHVYTIRIVDN